MKNLESWGLKLNIKNKTDPWSGLLGGFLRSGNLTIIMPDFKIFFKKGEERRIQSRHLFLGSLLVILILISFFTGVLFAKNQESVVAISAPVTTSSVKITGLGTTNKLFTVDFNLYWDVWNKLQEKFIGKPVADDNLFYSSLEGLVAAANDPYTVFLRPQKAERFSQDLAGSFSGIGAELGMKKEVITIVAPLSESPAEKAGIKAGDKVLAVDGKDTYGWTLDEAVNKIRGKKGTPVKLLILRNNESAPREISIIRDTIVIKSVKWEMKNNAAYIQISNFNEDTAGLFDKAVTELISKNPSAFIIDLRNDPGGFLDTAVRLASEWIPKGKVVTEKFSDGHEENYISDGKHRLDNFETYVLINQGSASASEILAGALQDYGKATLVGEKSFGKGSVQEYEQLSDGSALKITVAEWLTPKGRHINNNGIEPDIKMVPVAASSTASVVENLVNPQKDTVLEDVLKLIK
ncbi:MAG: Carboxyl-terminal protease [Candidatus Magasanikbacteria bacterium GW2011_GWC2_40_17]|uniref:Carboxyl-terminal protease n=1 Tax=Candidatus Magasanikbacteria bacterium GW2011_GWA2_42_32 TaxID=1619039 RepID=A0A0G1A9I7_9BACT|nr:MAG: Carboxyl-terminal protease [Candidatus Magasanikbacteria bacterium GW2011_GWC2_40_17]KKS57619.1 MAG: Carboxyl-terminal protease [Candidatus Magasanikbacteria bacterium GW2011_GWA2_42_32]OGH85021.1 MAG: hypothetical protein A2294_01855 [Candidatus Magasanikbacteria bacterium RIFOXYB2_FULL_38_10]